MSCKCAKFDWEDGIYYCDISGNQCMFIYPSSKRCAEKYGEGPDVIEEDDDED